MPPKKTASASKTKPASSSQDIDSLFAGIDDINPSSGTASRKSAEKSRSATADDEEKALLAEIEGLTAEHRAPSRPVTPRPPSGAAAGTRPSTESLRKKSAEVVAAKGPATKGNVPAVKEPSDDEDDEEDEEDDDEEEEDEDEDEEDETVSEKPTKRTSTKKPDALREDTSSVAGAGGGGGGGGAGGGGWLSGFWSTASTAVNVAQNTAQSVYKEIQSSEEAQRWTTQVKGSVQGIKEMTGEIQKRALPTFSTILQHIAPPISQHERLHIHTTHDLQNYPSIDPMIHSVFSRVMQQVEGGDLIVIQRGSESANKRNSSLSSGWGGGPWWRDERKRELGAVRGLEAGIKLAKATADGFASEYAQKSPTTEAPEDPNNPVRKSDIFLALQPVTYPSPFTAVISTKAEGESEDEVEDVLAFAIYLLDPNHHMAFTTMSQTFPAKWGQWMDAEFEELPEDVQMGLANGAVDPREWIAEWMEETIALAVGTVAQSYVSKRMGVGEGLGKGKEVLPRTDVNVGEEARVL